jgi:NADH-quinone oxidoreductase subunit B
MAVTPVSISKAVRAGDLEQYVMLTTLEKAMAWTSSNSIWPAGFGLACCAIEMMALPSPRYDIARFGSEVFRSSPRQADLMIVSGRVSHKMVAPLRQVYDQMLLPKWVMAMGACSSSGGMFANYAILQGVDKVVPVDVHVPGCPPRPEAVVDGLLLIQKKIRSGIAPAYDLEKSKA